MYTNYSKNASISTRLQRALFLHLFTMKEVSAEEILELSWKSYRENWKLLTVASAILISIYLGILLCVLGIVRGYNGSALALLFFLAFVAIVQLGFIKILLNITGNKPAVLKQLFGKHNLSVRYLIGTIGYTIMTLIGLCLLIVPGVLYAIRYSMWGFLLVNKDLDLVDSFKESKRITQGSKKDLFSLYLVLLGCNVVGVLLLGAGLLISLPISLLIVAYAYRKLQLVRTSEALQEKKSHWHVNY